MKIMFYSKVTAPGVENQVEIKSRESKTSTTTGWPLILPPRDGPKSHARKFVAHSACSSALRSGFQSASGLFGSGYWPLARRLNKERELETVEHCSGSGSDRQTGRHETTISPKYKHPPTGSFIKKRNRTSNGSGEYQPQADRQSCLQDFSKEAYKACRAGTGAGTSALGVLVNCVLGVRILATWTKMERGE